MHEDYDDEFLDNELPEEELVRSYRVTDLHGFCKETRLLVADYLRGTLNAKALSEKELDEFITVKQVENMLRELQIETNHHNDDDHLYINMLSYDVLFEMVMSQIYGSALSKLAAEGFLEQAWDDKLNDMVFWVKDPEAKKH
jgi:hypothetical protein